MIVPRKILNRARRIQTLHLPSAIREHKLLNCTTLKYNTQTTIE